ncbi:hypothetical protein ABO01nite_07810 [Asaia bogorensis NBRC 16594]|uniref:Uncharacterized protein n=1 Tax=Asaia bogorensis NBRC 16594 TaxID=1231624 RepID=A0AAN4R524_9PROT|nr:hypothetical protein ABO01nite_07810 [Asaia bogorensis NBRC 16594]
MSHTYLFRYRYIIRASKGDAGGSVSLARCRDGKEVNIFASGPESVTGLERPSRRRYRVKRWSRLSKEWG